MKRQICFVFLLFSILICGVSAVSAEDVSIADMEISDISTSSNLNVGESSSTSSNDINFTIDVRYEYSDDKSKIAPDFVVKADGNEIAYEKCLDENSKYILKLNQTSLSNIYNISVMASGYISNSQSINGDLLNDITFNLDATDSYKLGRELVINADKELDFSNADDVLVISSAGVPKYKGQTSQDAIEAIYNYQFKYGRSIPYNNVLMLRQTATDTIDFAFIVKKGKKLMAVIYENASKTPAYVGTISEDMTKDQWNNYFKALSGENAWAFASLANAWVDGAPNIVLQEAAFHGHVCEGTLGGYSIVQALLKYYPPIQSTPGEFGSPGDISSYKILGVPGGSDDDAVLFFLDATPGKSGYVGFNTTSTGATENMIAFIRWNNDHGDIVVMTYNITSNKNLFKKETGVNADDGSLEELKYNTWWINKIKNNPEDLVDILYEFSNLNETHYYNLIGNGKDVEAKGLDLEYILSLNLPKATRSNAVSTTGSLSKAQLEQIGIDATNKALEIFKANGYELSKDETDLGVFTSAGYVYLNTQETADIRIGLNKALGATLTSSTLLPIHVAVWKPLWFTYVLRNQNSDELMAVYLRYNPDGTWYIGQVGGEQVCDIGPNALNNSNMVKKLSTSFIPDGNWFNVQSIANAWKAYPEFDQLITFLFHDHACPGVQPGFFITDFIQSNYPLGENESYRYMGSSIYCKDDSLVYLLGVSPGMGTYFNQKLPEDETDSTYEDGATDEGVLIIWDDKLKVGRAVVITFKWATIDTSAYGTSEGKRAAQIQAYIDLYAGRTNSNVKEGVTVQANHETWINEEQYLALISGADNLNALSYIKGLPIVSKEDLLKVNTPNKNLNIESNKSSNSNYNNSNKQDSSNTRYQSNSLDQSASLGQSNSLGQNSVGISSNSLDGAGESADESGSDADQGESYEIESTTNKSINANNMVYALIGVLVIGILLGLGYIRRKNNN